MQLGLTIAGFALMAPALFDVFYTLFHPAGRGAMSDTLERGVWRLFKPLARRKPRAITLAGPTAFIVIISAWIALVVFGCSLVYAPSLPSGFALAPGLDPAAHHDYLDAFNISLGSLVTLTADFNARSGWIRLLMGAEGVLGFGILTASVSWLLSIYPVLENRRSYAHQVTLLHNAERETGVDPAALPAGEAQELLHGLTTGLTTLRNQMEQFPITYYFHMGEEKTSLPGMMPYLARLAERAIEPQRPESVRIAGTMLGGAVEDYLHTVAVTFLRMPTNDSGAIMRAFARDHMRELVQPPEKPRRAA